MNEIFSRQNIVFGSESLEKLKKSRVAVFGVGGVGGYVCEALARSGVGTLDIIDNDTVSETNINRQAVALHSTVGRVKVDVLRQRCLDINPDIDFCSINKRFCADNEDEFDFSDADYIVDAIDTVTDKIRLIEIAKEKGVKIISSMGTGNKCDPSKLTVADIYSTDTDPLAKVMRHELKKRGINSLKTVYSPEKPIKQTFVEDGATRPVTASVPWVPPVAGFMIAWQVISDICDIE